MYEAQYQNTRYCGANKPNKHRFYPYGASIYIFAPMEGQESGIVAGTNEHDHFRRKYEV